MDLPKSGPGQVGHPSSQKRGLFGATGSATCISPVYRGGGGTVCLPVEPAAAGALDHSHHRIGEQQSMLRIEPGIDQGVDGLGNAGQYTATAATSFELLFEDQLFDR